MALKPATTVIPADAYMYAAVQTVAKLDGIGDSAPQKTTPEGTPLWTVDALRTSPDGAADLISVTVPAGQNPAAAGPVVFEGLRAGLWLGERARQGGLFWQADAVKSTNSASRKGE